MPRAARRAARAGRLGERGWCRLAPRSSRTAPARVLPDPLRPLPGQRAAPAMSRRTRSGTPQRLHRLRKPRNPCAPRDTLAVRDRRAQARVRARAFAQRAAPGHDHRHARTASARAAARRAPAPRPAAAHSRPMPEHRAAVRVDAAGSREIRASPARPRDISSAPNGSPDRAPACAMRSKVAAQREQAAHERGGVHVAVAAAVAQRHQAGLSAPASAPDSAHRAARRRIFTACMSTPSCATPTPGVEIRPAGLRFGSSEARAAFPAAAARTRATPPPRRRNTSSPSMLRAGMRRAAARGSPHALCRRPRLRRSSRCPSPRGGTSRRSRPASRARVARARRLHHQLSARVRMRRALANCVRLEPASQGAGRCARGPIARSARGGGRDQRSGAGSPTQAARPRLRSRWRATTSGRRAHARASSEPMRLPAAAPARGPAGRRSTPAGSDRAGAGGFTLLERRSITAARPPPAAGGAVVGAPSRPGRSARRELGAVAAPQRAHAAHRDVVLDAGRNTG